MRSLFGQGRHPNAEALATEMLEAGGNERSADAAGRLGAAFHIYSGAPGFRQEVARRLTAHWLHPPRRNVVHDISHTNSIAGNALTCRR